MNFKTLLDEAINRGEKIKAEVLSELFKSKTIQELVSNKNFIKAITRLIETKEEVKKVISKQIKIVFDMMEVPTKGDLLNIGKQLSKLEAMIHSVGSKKIPVNVLKKKKAAPARKKAIKKKTTKRKK